MPKAYVRFLHALPVKNGSSPAVDIYVNDTLMARNFKYENFTEYLEARPGTYNIKVTPTNKTKPLINQDIVVDNGMIYTVAVIGPATDPMLETIIDKHRPVSSSVGFIRFINLSPDDTTLDIAINNNVVLSEMNFKDISDYISLKPKVYNLKAINHDTGKVVMEDPRMEIDADKYYAGYLVGFSDAQPELQILLPMEGTTYLNLNDVK